MESSKKSKTATEFCFSDITMSIFGSIMLKRTTFARFTESNNDSKTEKSAGPSFVKVRVPAEVMKFE
jgi:hypothetical protein